MHAIFGKTVAPILLFSLFIFFAPVCHPALAMEDLPDQGDSDTSTPDDTNYFSYAYKQIDFLSKTDGQRWGYVTPLLPKGFFSIHFSSRFLRWDSKYDEDGNSERFKDQIKFSDPTSDFFNLNVMAKGSSQFHNLFLSYGITDSLDLVFNAPMVYQNNRMIYDFMPGKSSAMGLRSTKEFIDFLEELGRPRPVLKYVSVAWEMSDINLGTDWNFFRNHNFSSVFSWRAILPTGRLADPNQALIFGLGPQLDSGKGSFGFNSGFGFDFRPPKPVDIMHWALKGEYSYRFKGKRRAPAFHEPNQNAVNSLDAFGVNTDYYPDLSKMDDYYYVTPQSAFDGLAYWGFDLKYVDFGLGYQYHWRQEPLVDSDSKAFEKMLDLYGSFTSVQRGNALAYINVPMYHYHVPLEIYFEYRLSLHGKNSFVFKDDYQGGAKLYIPF